MSSLTAIGIDLGTTYSAMAIVDDHGKPMIIPNTDSERLTPSAVFFDDDTIIVGQDAKDKAVSHPSQVALFTKRQMGNPHWFLTHNSHRCSPVDVAALILKKLRQDAEQYLKRPITHAVITVPAYFDDAKRRLTMEAGKIAGLEVLGIVNEPTAAAIAYGIDGSQQSENVLVYDLGGGTFDITVMQVDGTNITVRASKGDPQLGGKDFDDKLIALAVERFQQEYGVDPTYDARDAGDIRASAERVKRELSKRAKALMVVRAQGRSVQFEVTREQFERLIRPRIETTLTLVKLVLDEAGLSVQHIDRILLVGGSTRIPMIHDALGQFFGRQPEPHSAINPDESVAIGAALLAAKKVADSAPQTIPPSVTQVVGGLQVTDVVSHSFGIEVSNPNNRQISHFIVIKRNTPIPAQESQEFATDQPNQTVIQVQIYQGESKEIAECNPVGAFVLSGLPAGRPAGCKVRVSFTCDADGVVHVTAVDIASGVEATTTVGYKTGQSSEQVSARQRWMKTKAVQ